MKKLVALVLAVTMCLVMGAWAFRNPEAMSAYKDMQTAMGEVTSTKAYISGYATAFTEEESVDILFDANLYEVYTSATQAEMAVSLNVYYKGVKANYLSFYKDGYWYENANGVKTKRAMDLNSAIEMAHLAEVTVNSDVAKRSDINYVAAAGTTLKFELDPTVQNALMADILEMVGNDLVASGKRLTVDDILYTIVLDGQNRIKTSEIDMSARWGIPGDYISLDYHIDMKTVEYNTYQTIGFPADLETYTAA